MASPSLIPILARAVVEVAEAGTERAVLECALDFALVASAADMGAVFQPAGPSLRLTLGRHLPQPLQQQPPLLEAAAWTQGPLLGLPGRGPELEVLEQHARLVGIQSWASVPFTYRESSYGILLVASRDLIGFSREALEYLGITARVVAMALVLLGSRYRTSVTPAPTF